MQPKVSVINKIVLFVFTWLCLLGSSYANNREWNTRKMYILENDSVYLVSLETGVGKEAKLKYGLLNSSQCELIPPIYDEISILRYDLLDLRLGDKCGLYNMKGKELLPIEYSFIYHLAENYYIVSDGDKFGVFDSNRQRLVVPVRYENFAYKDIETKTLLATPKHLSRKPTVLTVVLRSAEGVSLFDLTDEKTLIPFGKYDNIECSDKNQFARVTKGSMWEIINYEGQKYASSEEYATAEITPYGIITTDYASEKLLGFISPNGTTIEPTFDNLNFTNKGVALIWMDKDSKYGALHTNSKIIVPMEYRNLYVTEKYIEVALGDYIGVIDFDGEVIFPPTKYENINYFPDYKLAVVVKNEKFGLVDTKDKVIVPIKYSSVYFNDGIARASITKSSNVSEWEIYNLKTNKQIKLKPLYSEIAKFVDGVAVAAHFSAEGNSYELIDENGKQLGSTYNVIFFDEKQQYATVQVSDAKWGMIGARGEILVPTIFDQFTDHSVQNDEDGVAIAKKGDKYGAYNFHEKKELLSPIYDNIRPVKRKWLLNRIGDKSGLMDMKGKKILATENELIHPLGHDRFIVVQGARYGVVNNEETIVVPYEYDYLSPMLTEDEYLSYLIVQKGDKVGVIDYANKIVFDFDFDLIAYSHELGCYIASKGGQNGVLDLKKKKFMTAEELSKQD